MFLFTFKKEWKKVLSKEIFKKYHKNMHATIPVVPCIIFFLFNTFFYGDLKLIFNSLCSVAKKSSMNRSKSASNLSLSGTSLLNKSTIREARPIESKKLRKTLSQSQDLSNITATPRVWLRRRYNIDKGSLFYRKLPKLVIFKTCKY